MARFFGAVGYGEAVENPSGSGIWVDEITEMDYQGDIIRNIRHLGSPDKVNADIVVENSISVVADEYATQNFINIKYVKWMGTPWVVTSVQVQSPRLILSLGGVYNGPTS